MDIHQRNNVRSFGYGTKTILFAHGFGCDQTMWRYITPAFEFGYRVILFDFVGSGRSDVGSYCAKRYSRLEGYADDILDICSALELKDVILVGHSISGIIGMLAGLRKPELFSNIIMIGSSPCYLNQGSEYTGGYDKVEVDNMLRTIELDGNMWANAFSKRAMGNPDRPELSVELTGLLSDMEKAVARQFAEVAYYSDCRDKLKALKIPTLIMQGGEDSVVPEAVARYLHEHIAGSRLEMLEAVGHYPCLSAPDEIIEVIKNYLEAGKVMDIEEEELRY